MSEELRKETAEEVSEKISEESQKTTAPELDAIIIDDGRIDIPIRNQNGEEMGTFRFNPTDINVVNRYNEMADKFEEILQPLVNFDIDSNGEAGDMAAVDALNTAENGIIDLFDYVFDGNSRESFFKTIHAFAPTNGKFYCEVVYEAIGNFISKSFEQETKKLRFRVQNYTHGYRTGKHRKGRK